MLDKNNMKVLGLTILLTACAGTPSVAVSYDDAMMQANQEIDKAAALNYEWRDSRKLLKKAASLEKEGQHDKAMQLIAAASKQGKLAVAQAHQQADVTGPY